MTDAQIALYYKNSLAFSDIDVVVFVEDTLSEFFWDDVFQKYAPALKLGFKYNLPELNETGGVISVLRFQDYADAQLLLCIDSDYEYMMGNYNFLMSNKFIFQTYVYSIENYFCTPNNLSAVCTKATLNENKLMDIANFLASYSQIVAPLFKLIVDDVTEREQLFDTIALDGYFNVDEHELILEDLQKKVTTKLNEWQSVKGTPSQFIVQKLRDLEIADNDIYLLLRGKSLLNAVIKPLLRSVCERLRNQKYQEIKQLSKEEANQKRNIYQKNIKCTFRTNY